MSVRRVAMLSVHTSPLAQPGTGDSGGMNVYVRSLASALVAAGVDCDVITRAEHPEQPPVVEVEPGFRVVHVDAGPRRPVDKDALPGLVDELAVAARDWIVASGGVDALHANYWISGAVSHVLKHELDLPMVATFHTLTHIKAAAGVADDHPDRARIEADVIRCADGLVASTQYEREQLVHAYDADPDRIDVIPAGVDHATFSTGDRVAARRRLRLADRPTLLFVGRIQPLKGVDLAVRTLAELDDPTATLLVVGGPSGVDGTEELARVRSLVVGLGLEDQVQFVPPRVHEALTPYYRAADVVLVPSRTESFGLVALEAAACGTPVVAADVGGLRSIVDDGVTGFLVPGRDPADYAARVRSIICDPARAAGMGAAAAARSQQFTWSITAARLRRLYADLPARELVQCT
jgi:D-inositol-3-phosphate glycosyltransferase